MKREREASMEEGEANQQVNEAIVWKEISPHLDDAMATLPRKLEEAVLLCFFQEKPRSEAAAIMSCTEKALSKRINRALEKLHIAFSRKGITAPVLTLTAILSTRATELKAASVIASLSQNMIIPAALTTQVGVLSSLSIPKTVIVSLAMIGSVTALTLKYLPEDEAVEPTPVVAIEEVILETPAILEVIPEALPVVPDIIPEIPLPLPPIVSPPPPVKPEPQKRRVVPPIHQEAKVEPEPEEEAPAAPDPVVIVLPGTRNETNDELPEGLPRVDPEDVICDFNFEIRPILTSEF